MFKNNNNGLWYSGITHDSGSCNPGSIPGSPTIDKGLVAHLVERRIRIAEARSSSLLKSTRNGSKGAVFLKDFNEKTFFQSFDKRASDNYN